MNGHILDNIADIQSNLSFAQPGQFFRNEGGRFQDRTASVGTAIGRPRVGRALASLDFDRDGDLDLAISSSGGDAELLRNDGGNDNGFIGLRLVGVNGNRDGVGARLTLELDGRPWVDEVRAGSSYLAQNEATLYVGLGKHLESRLPLASLAFRPGGRDRSSRGRALVRRQRRRRRDPVKVIAGTRSRRRPS